MYNVGNGDTGWLFCNTAKGDCNKVHEYEKTTWNGMKFGPTKHVFIKTKANGW